MREASSSNTIKAEVNAKPQGLKLVATLLLMLTHFAAGLAILIVASWFIAACSIAGMGFNYMLPAVVIRALAILRIASGYFSMLVGHNHLLNKLAALRLKIFAGLENKVSISREQSLDALHHQSEEVASIWIAWVGQNAGILLSLAMLNLVSIVLLPPLTTRVIIFTGIFMFIYLGLLIAMLKVSANIVAAKKQAQFAILQHIEAAPIWHLLHSYNKNAPRLNKLRELEASQQRQVRNASLLLMLSGMGLLITILSHYSGEYLGHAEFIVLPILLLSLNDWLTPALANQKQLVSYVEAKKAIQDTSTNTQDLSVISEHIDAIEVAKFKPIDTNMNETNAHFNKDGVNVLVGSSGAGKSRFLKALAGLIEHQGSRELEFTTHAQSKQHGLLSDAVYLEQFPYVLSDTVRANLQVANLNASDANMRQVLNLVGLYSLDNLDQWLGENGRLLSGGEKKRLGLARAMLSQANLLLLDEPFESLDEENIQRVSLTINRLATDKIVIVATHILPKGLFIRQCCPLEVYDEVARYHSNK
ncbi:ATP-binding cassette domain-containing protein [uncultured Paraglaciecola sp.]|uniref:ATP-binding cassette domain-containing protein n=1 Tax=uncultured Paraglaciecola sp. TaxID=1765024 RepID=UPI002598488B|nr:ATP-binding cassette domain-containing protein [uncultured Paraglaciecola sp.]